jgi:hypothetical protein
VQYNARSTRLIIIISSSSSIIVSSSSSQAKSWYVRVCVSNNRSFANELNKAGSLLLLLCVVVARTLPLFGMPVVSSCAAAAADIGASFF